MFYSPNLLKAGRARAIGALLGMLVFAALGAWLHPLTTLEGSAARLGIIGAPLGVAIVRVWQISSKPATESRHEMLMIGVTLLAALGLSMPLLSN